MNKLQLPFSYFTLYPWALSRLNLVNKKCLATMFTKSSLGYSLYFSYKFPFLFRKLHFMKSIAEKIKVYLVKDLNEILGWDVATITKLKIKVIQGNGLENEIQHLTYWTKMVLKVADKVLIVYASYFLLEHVISKY